jgi:hypothetical protein
VPLNMSTNPFFNFYASRIPSLVLFASDGISLRLPIALPILYTISKTISVGTKPIVRNVAASPGFIT